MHLIYLAFYLRQIWTIVSNEQSLFTFYHHQAVVYLRFSSSAFIFRCLCDLVELKGRTDLLLTVLDKSTLTQIICNLKMHFLSSPVFIWKLILLLIQEFRTFKIVRNEKYPEISADPALAPLVNFLQP